jgi:hypothetical protein
LLVDATGYELPVCPPLWQIYLFKIIYLGHIC